NQPVSVRVASGVGDRLLSDAEKGDVDVSRESAYVTVETNLDLGLSSCRVATREEGQCRGERAIVELGGWELTHQSPRILHSFAAQDLDVVDLAQRHGRVFVLRGVASPAGGHDHRREPLSERVVDLT